MGHPWIRRTCALACVALVADACAARSAPPAETPVDVVQVAAISSAAVLVPAPSAPSSATLPPLRPPAGYVEIEVLETLPVSGSGAAVLLFDRPNELYLPIFIGGTEAAAIQGRLSGRKERRPLTHDLLDTILRTMGARVWKVHVDELRDNVFIGTVFVRQGDQVFDVDSRASDAIALALGNRAPVYVARKVLDAAGVMREQLFARHGLRPRGSAPAQP